MKSLKNVVSTVVKIFVKRSVKSVALASLVLASAATYAQEGMSPQVQIKLAMVDSSQWRTELMTVKSDVVDYAADVETMIHKFQPQMEQKLAARVNQKLQATMTYAKN